MSNKDSRKIPLKDITPQPQTKNNRGWPSFFLILFALGAITISPLPSYLASLIPKSIINSVMAPIAQKIILDENPAEFSAPRKYEHTSPLPVLGRESGLCFTFSNLDEYRLKRAKHGRIIAEIIAVGDDNKEYTLDEVNLTNAQEKIICQSFSRSDSLIPKTVNEIYIRPLSPFSPITVTWASMREFR